MSAALVAEQAQIDAPAPYVLDATVTYEVIGNETLLARWSPMWSTMPSATMSPTAWSSSPTICSDGMALPRGRQCEGPFSTRPQAQHLGEPFHRLGPERVANNDGAGLGLSIVQGHRRRPRRELQLHARPEGGLRVVIELPTAPVRV